MSDGARTVRRVPDPSSCLDAVRAAYDTVAVDYENLLRTALAAKPLDRAMLAAFAELVRADGDFPVAERKANRIFSLPMYPYLTDEQVDEVIAAVREVM